MRIAIVTQDDPFYLPPALDRLCAAKRPSIAALIVLPAFNERRVATARRLFEFYGPLDFTRLLARYAGAKLADRLNRVRPITRPFSARDVARRHDLPLWEPDDLNDPAAVAHLRDEIRPDLLVSIAASQILKPPVLEIPPKGCINVHSGCLPRFQGMMPVFWTLVSGEPQATVSVHYMVPRLDAGDLIMQEPVPLEPGDSLHDVIVRTKVKGMDMLVEAIDRIDRGTVSARPMDLDQATRFTFPKRDDARKLRKAGRALL